ncbi:MAG TPA: histidine--tRNA ligase [Gammaproteobacteria bacterium]|nr:histidine--tRNA ligase [Gammaproteobacteria bacterium]
MAKFIEPVRGMNDILPEAMPRWQRLEHVTREVLESYGYREIRIPIVEKTELFKRSIGDTTDIVEKEMYTFIDRSEESLTLRPEATAGMVRAGLSNGLLYNQVQRLWCAGPMFRHERPQKGRYRQFHQINVEAFGLAGPDIDAELILMSARLWRRLGLRDGAVRLQINSLGTPGSRAAYRETLVAYLEKHRGQLDEDSQRRLSTNPLRVLDSKNPAMREVLAAAPSLLDHLDGESRAHFEGLQGFLDGAGVVYTVNPRLVRGLDYYSRTVFEWIIPQAGAQDAVCSGGRYDGLVEHLGGKPTPGIGFALGVERLVALMEDAGSAVPDAQPHVYLVRVGERAERESFRLAEGLREKLPALRLQMDCSGGGFGHQLKRADKSGAGFALILGEEEAAAGRATLKPLRGGEQESLDWDALPARLGKLLD